tara:strand:+ start:4669 stop:6414 length:1746 start_codon:yes stop_codon:yes gene_type:complete
MAITKSNVIFVYRAGDSESLELAQLYQSVHNLDGDQIVSVPCSRKEILADQSAFDQEVLTPLKTFLDTTSRTIWVIVLGLNVPGGFRRGTNVISSTSRVSRINHSFSEKIGNFLFNRSAFKRFDAVDARFALITSRIDAPDLATAKAMVNGSATLLRQKLANGKFYIDPFANVLGKAATVYTDEILRFVDKILPKLNLDIFTTVFLDPYIDVVIPLVEDDSFVWSWIADRSSLSFFKETNALRIFFYNADFDGAKTIRTVEERTWPALAVSSEYILTAGAMSDPSVEGLLRPQPFFDSLLRGTTFGEAYMFSCPYLDWTMTLFGDPLAEVSFPAGVPDDDSTIDPNESWRRMSIDLSKAFAYMQDIENRFENVIERIVLSIDVPTEVDLLNPSVDLINGNDAITVNAAYLDVISGLIGYATVIDPIGATDQLFPSFNEYLEKHNYEISSLLTNVLPQAQVNAENILTTDTWEIDFELIDEVGSFVFYNFELQLSSDSDFNNILFTIDSSDITNWKFERDVDEFVEIEKEGVGSNYVGRRIRYNSLDSQKLDSLERFFIRVRQKSNGIKHNYRFIGEDIVFT